MGTEQFAEIIENAPVGFVYTSNMFADTPKQAERERIAGDMNALEMELLLEDQLDLLS